MNQDRQSRDPFTEFINSSLDMEGVEGLDQAVVAEKMHRILRELPTNVTPDLWSDRLDSLQSVIRICLDLNTVLGTFDEQVDPPSFSRDDLESLIMLSVTFAFVSYNDMHPSYAADAAPSDDSLLTRRLRDTLKVTLGWITRAARQGDPVAARLADEINSLLSASSHLD